MERDFKAVVEHKLQQKLEKGMISAQAAMQRLTAENKIAKDFLFEVGTSNRGKESNLNFVPVINDNRVYANLNMPEGVENFVIHPHAVRQVSEKLSVPFSYLNTLLNGEEWQKLLGLKILNTHNGYLERSPILVRSVGKEIRGVMSASYRRLNEELIFNTYLEEVYANGGQLSDGFMDDTRVMMEAVVPEPIEIRTPKNGVIWMVFGQRFTDSGYGDGATNLVGYMVQGVCLNGMTRERLLREVHLGARLDVNEGFSQKTLDLNSELIASAIKDKVKSFFSPDFIKERMLEIKAASAIETDPYTQLQQMFSAGKLLKNEADEIGKVLMRGNPMDGIQGESTLWKLTQGITKFANNEKLEARRKFELQKIAGDLFNDLKN